MRSMSRLGAWQKAKESLNDWREVNMSDVNRKDKYCLKGEFYEALDEVNRNLQGIVPNHFRKEVYSDLIDVFYRNQSQSKSFSEAMGCSLDDFIAYIVGDYYSTLGRGKYINHLF